MKLQLKAGTTSQPLYIFIQDSSVTTGAGKTGLAYNTASLVAYYVRPLGSATAITLVTQTVTGAYSSGGFVEVDATNMPGLYRLDVPDAALATGKTGVVVMLKGAANMAPCVLEIELVAYDPQDAVRAGLTALPTALVGGRMDSSIGAVAAGAIAAAGLNADTDAYQAKAWLTDDNTGTNDRYVVVWFKNGQPITSGITLPTIQVFKAADGLDLIASVAMTEIGTTQTFRYNEPTNRVVNGAVYIAKMQATIGGSVRTWYQPVGRDS